MACRLTISKVYKVLAILEMQVSRIKAKFFKIKGLTFKGLRIKARKNAGATAALEDISGDTLPPPEGRRKYPRRPPPRLKRERSLAIACPVPNRLAMARGRRLVLERRPGLGPQLDRGRPGRRGRTRTNR